MGHTEENQTFAGEIINHAPSGGSECAPRHQSPHDRFRDLITWTALANGSTYEMVMSRARAREVSRARRACIVALHHARPDLSYVRIGRVFGLDHTTVMHALGRAGVYRRGYRNERNREMKACESVARFLRSLRRHMGL